MTRTFTDQCGNRMTLSGIPRRVVSLVPSQTELLFHLGLENQIVGITKFCIHPPHAKHEKTLIGGTKNFDIDRIRALAPDLIIGNKEENNKEAIELLQREFPVWMSDVVTLSDALDMIESVGDIFQKKQTAAMLAEQVRNSVSQLPKHSPRRALYLIWKDPWMAAGRETFINTVLGWISLTNVIEKRRYPELSDSDIRALSSEFILLSSEPYPFKEKHIEELKQLSPASKIILVDGEMFSWYGSRLLSAIDYLSTLPLD